MEGAERDRRTGEMLQPQPGRRRREEEQEERKQRRWEREESSAGNDRGTRGHLQLLCDSMAGKDTKKWLSLTEVISPCSSPAEQIPVVCPGKDGLRSREGWIKIQGHPGRRSGLSLV